MEKGDEALNSLTFLPFLHTVVLHGRVARVGI